MGDVIYIERALLNNEFEAMEGRLAQSLKIIGDELYLGSVKIANAPDAVILGKIVNVVAEKLAEASERWSALSKLIR